jgi:Ni,Fe-hydrogenase III large subunit
MTQETKQFVTASVGLAIPRREIPFFPLPAFHQEILRRVARGERVVALFGSSTHLVKVIRLYAILADDEGNCLHLGQSKVEGLSYPSLTPECPQVHLFEREIAEQFGLIPTGHPWFKPVRYHRSWTKNDAWGRSPETPILPAVGDFFRVEGEQIHEVAVGPVHAGIIEPGHFRFQCHGEKVLHLEIALGFQHRGVEQTFEGGPDKRSLHYAETLAGDSTIAHATSYCQALEGLSGTKVSARAHSIRGIALELERLANHVGDLGALSGDVGFLPTASFCGRIRGDFLNMTALLCGNRFGRALVRPGGVGFNVDEALQAELLKRLAISETEATQAITLLWENQSVMARFEDAGPLSKENAMAMGIVGPAARASGLSRDVRYYQPSGIYRFSQIPVSTYDSGDVFGRAYVRWLEVQQSIQFIRDLLEALPGGNPLNAVAELAPSSVIVSLNEGWRGEVCHVAVTDDRRRLKRYKVVDPSFHNWSGLALAMRDQEISDFPICNKSFSLSYCGHDL